ncbi:DUF192 domain-containing protein [Endomicrobium proavitum]|uniref:DUF192 domain-containing protein n=1 Tax=Endomicrobium proavitum TaxID=1408281 RepID=A0A0G3WIV5_9BACT|nr:DUF192 domain-containing protein [Endomicrobium proavitum]AKL97820.1 hypothetical protein Epro_0441 [Endomicrobium proavitum]
MKKLKILQAKTFLERFCGFMFKENAGYALFFKNCTSVHTFFMKFNINVVFLNKKNEIISIKKNVRPWRLVLPVKNAVSILEIPTEIAPKNAENLKKSLNLRKFAVKMKK